MEWPKEDQQEGEYIGVFLRWSQKFPTRGRDIIQCFGRCLIARRHEFFHRILFTFQYIYVITGKVKRRLHQIKKF